MRTFITLFTTSAALQGHFTVTAAQPVRYTVSEVCNLLHPSNPTLLQGLVPGRHPPELAPPPAGPLRRIIFVDDNVLQLYGDALHKVGMGCMFLMQCVEEKSTCTPFFPQYFESNCVEHCIVGLCTNEATKTVDLLMDALQAMDAFKLNRRRDPVIAVGGGVCLDVCGFAAALYRRGTPIIKVGTVGKITRGALHGCLVQVPTTLMGVVDASVGVKNAINAFDAKNKLGTYTPPVATLIDTDFLHTLPARHLANGAAEIVKMAMVKDGELFDLLHTHHATLMVTRFQVGAP